jgi:light-regulated signal transduction histidine kinase (bacteriophytochrome)
MIKAKLKFIEEFNYPEQTNPNLSLILYDAIHKLKFIFKYNQIECKVTADEISSVKGHFELIKYMFDEIIGNAIKYGTNTTKVNLSKNHNGAMFFEVSNKCININKFETKDIKAYKKFHKEIENSLGIGLINCKKICENYDYEFNVQCETNLFYASICIPNKYFTKPT